MTDKEKIAMLREALEGMLDICGDCFNKAEATLAATEPSAQGREKVDERAEFENWLKTANPYANLERMHEAGWGAAGTEVGDRYRIESTQWNWEVWQARAALRSE